MKKKKKNIMEGRVKIGFDLPGAHGKRRDVMVHPEGHYKASKRKPSEPKKVSKLTKSILKG